MNDQDPNLQLLLTPTSSCSHHDIHSKSNDTAELYPLVQDLSDTEIGEKSDGKPLGSSSLEDLAMPKIEANPVPTSLTPPRELPPTKASNSKNTNHHHHHHHHHHRHSRGQSFFQFPALFRRSSSRSRTHKRAHSAPIATGDKKSSSLQPPPSPSVEHTSRSFSSEVTEDSYSTAGAMKKKSSLPHTPSLAHHHHRHHHVDPVIASFEDLFVLTRQIIRCHISTVWECIHRENGTRHCVKMVDKRRFVTRTDEAAVQREIQMLTTLQIYQSNFLPRLIHISEDEHQFYIVMDLVEGGDLATLAQNSEGAHLPEDHVKSITRSLLIGLSELHRLSVAHFHLSPENILLESNLSDVVICDFGHAWDLGHAIIQSRSHRNGRERATVHEGTDPMPNNGINRLSEVPRYGALPYAAPEIVGHEKEFGLPADLWSVGVIVYELLCGKLPFQDMSKKALKEKIVGGKAEFKGKNWNNVSRAAKQFISALLHTDPQVRLTVGEALTHPWIALSTSSCDRVVDEIISKEDQKQPTGLVQRFMHRLRTSTSQERQSPTPPSSSNSGSNHQKPIENNTCSFPSTELIESGRISVAALATSSPPTSPHKRASSYNGESLAFVSESDSGCLRVLAASPSTRRPSPKSPLRKLPNPRTLELPDLKRSAQCNHQHRRDHAQSLDSQMMTAAALSAASDNTPSLILTPPRSPYGSRDFAASAAGRTLPRPLEELWRPGSSSDKHHTH